MIWKKLKRRAFWIESKLMKRSSGQVSPEMDLLLDIVQKEADKLNKGFFLDCEDGNDSVIDGVKVCDLFGWFIPK